MEKSLGFDAMTGTGEKYSAAMCKPLKGFILCGKFNKHASNIHRNITDITGGLQEKNEYNILV